MPEDAGIGEAALLMWGIGAIGTWYYGKQLGNALTSHNMSADQPPSTPAQQTDDAKDGAATLPQAAAGSGCKGCGPDDKNKDKKKKPKDVLSDATRDPDKPTLSDGTEQYTKPGGMQEATDDFNSMDPQNVQSKGGGVQTGELSDGTQLVVRPRSVPSLEINPTSGPASIIRYK